MSIISFTAFSLQSKKSFEYGYYHFCGKMNGESVSAVFYIPRDDYFKMYFFEEIDCSKPNLVKSIGFFENKAVQLKNGKIKVITTLGDHEGNQESTSEIYDLNDFNYEDLKSKYYLARLDNKNAITFYKKL